MKTVLLASTAVVFWTGLAAAQGITLSGSAEMGIIGSDLFDDDDDGDDDGADLQFHTDIDVTFTMAGETDSGLTFGANVDLDESDGDPSGAFENTDQGGESIFVSGAFGTLTMGDTDGALDWALSEAIIGSTIDDLNEHSGWNGNDGLDETYDGQIARYEYAFNDFAVAISGEIDDTDDGDPILGLGVRYVTAFGGADVAFGAGVQTLSGLDDLGETILDEDEDFAATVYGVSADVSVQGVQVILNYSAADVDGLDDDVNPQHYGIAVGYTMDALTVAASYGHFEEWVVKDAPDSEGYSLVANYDLGGGAELQAGYAHNIEGANDFDVFSFGIAMSF